MTDTKTRFLSRWLLVPNRWNQTLCLVISPSIKKRGKSASCLSEQGKDGITTSLSLPEHPDSRYMHSYAEYLLPYLIKQLIWTVVLLYEIIFVDISTFLEFFISLKHTLWLLIQNGRIQPLKV